MKQKLKICVDCNKLTHIFSKGRCTQCAKVFSFFNRKNAPQRTKTVLKYGKINPESVKQKNINFEYFKVRKMFMAEHKICQVKVEGCTRVSMECHQATGRNGQRTTWVKYFVAVCRNCHNWIHNNPIEAEAKGFWIPPSKRKNLTK